MVTVARRRIPAGSARARNNCPVPAAPVTGLWAVDWRPWSAGTPIPPRTSEESALFGTGGGKTYPARSGL